MAVDEATWRTCNDAQAMVDFVLRRASARKLRLFACACCRLMDRRGNTDGLQVVAMAEEIADPKELLDLAGMARSASAICRLFADALALDADLVHAAQSFAGTAAAWRTLRRPDLLRCLFEPFRNTAADPAWLSWRGGLVVSVAQAAYENRLMPSGLLDTTRLAILADALEEAGCDRAEWLGHLRGPGPHVRGCWALDSLLAKS
jgi:hypothetical protein